MCKRDSDSAKVKEIERQSSKQIERARESERELERGREREREREWLSRVTEQERA